MKRIEFSSDYGLHSARNRGIPPPFRSRRAHLFCQRSSPFDEIDHRQHGEGAIGVLRQTAIAHLGKVPQPLERQERMLDLRAHTGFAPVRVPVGIGQGRIPVGALVGVQKRIQKVLRPRRNPLEPLPLRPAPVGAVAIEPDSSPCNMFGTWWLSRYGFKSCTLAAVTLALWTRPIRLSAPMCNFMPKCHSLPFFVWCISGSRAFLWFLVDGGAAIRVASTIVPPESFMPLAKSNLPPQARAPPSGGGN